MQRTLVVILVTLGSALAAAQPSTVDPIAPEPVPSSSATATPRYPRSLAERPLLLPDDAFEIGADFFFRNDNRAYFAGSSRIESPLFEVGLGITYQLDDRIADDGARLASVYVSGLRKILSCRVPQLAVGGQLVGKYLFGDFPGFSPSFIAQYKHTFRPWFALHTFGSAGYEYSRAKDPTTDWESAQHGLAGTLGTRAQLQPSPVIAFEFRVALSYRHDLGDYTPLGLTSFGSQTLGGMMLISASSNADIYFSYDAVLRAGDRQYETILFGFAARRI